MLTSQELLRCILLRSLQKNCMGWGCGSADRVLAFSPMFDPQHGINQVWWHTSVIPGLGKQRYRAIDDPHLHNEF